MGLYTCIVIMDLTQSITVTHKKSKNTNRYVFHAFFLFPVYSRKNY